MKKIDIMKYRNRYVYKLSKIDTHKILGQYRANRVIRKFNKKIDKYFEYAGSFGRYEELKQYSYFLDGLLIKGKAYDKYFSSKAISKPLWTFNFVSRIKLVKRFDDGFLSFEVEITPVGFDYDGDIVPFSSMSICYNINQFYIEYRDYRFMSYDHHSILVNVGSTTTNQDSFDWYYGTLIITLKDVIRQILLGR